MFLPYIVCFLRLFPTAQQNKEEKEFKCPVEQGNGNFADPVTCRRFYQVRRANQKHDRQHMLQMCWRCWQWIPEGVGVRGVLRTIIGFGLFFFGLSFSVCFFLR